jgi:hypothetical protein
LSGNLRAMLNTVLYADVDIKGSLIYLLSTRWFELLDNCCLCTASFLYQQTALMNARSSVC